MIGTPEEYAMITWRYCPIFFPLMAICMVGGELVTRDRSLDVEIGINFFRLTRHIFLGEIYTVRRKFHYIFVETHRIEEGIGFAALIPPAHVHSQPSIN